MGTKQEFSTCSCERCHQNLSMFGLTGPVTLASLTEAYKDLTKVWHPDRFEADQRLRKKAEEQFKNLQVAFRELQEHSKQWEPKRPEPKRPEPTRPSTGSSSERVYSSARERLCSIADGNRIFVSPNLPPYATENIARHFPVQPGRLAAFINLSANGKSFIAFYPDRFVVRAFLTKEVVTYEDFAGWDLTLRDKSHGKDPIDSFCDQLAASFGGDTSDLDIVLERPGTYRTIFIALGDRRTSALYPVFQEIQRRQIL